MNRRPLHRLVDEQLIVAGKVRVDGRVVTNPRSLVATGSSVVVVEDPELRGATKLAAALDHFGITVDGRVALDVGAAAGGFTSVLLERGARRVYAVDAGHGQLRGWLRQDPRVASLEATNVADLTRDLVDSTVDLVTVDVSYLSLSGAVAQLDRVAIAPQADLVGLVKPMFELGLGRLPTEDALLHEALAAAVRGVEAAGWVVEGTMPSPVTGARGAVEFLLWGRR